jgi:hypothetical protein
VTSDKQRRELAALMDYLHAQRAKVHYAEVRPMQTRRIRSWALLHRAVESPAGITMDCSESVTLLCKLAGLDDPNGFGYDGTGYTGTLLHHLPHYTSPRRAKVGGLVVFGPGSGDHVCMVRHPGVNPTLFSHGQEAGPLYVTLADESKAHRPPVTFLSIAHLG